MSHVNGVCLFVCFQEMKDYKNTIFIEAWDLVVICIAGGMVNVD